MKKYGIITVCLIALIQFANSAPKTEENHIIQMGRQIANHYKFSDVFVFDKVSYNEETKLWSFTPRFATTAGIHTLEIRDRDHHFRVGFLGNSGKYTKLATEFRLTPKFRRIFAKILKDKE